MWVKVAGDSLSQVGSKSGYILDNLAFDYAALSGTEILLTWTITLFLTWWLIHNNKLLVSTVTGGERSSRQRLAPLLSSLTLSQLIPNLPDGITAQCHICQHTASRVVKQTAIRGNVINFINTLFYQLDVLTTYWREIQFVIWCQLHRKQEYPCKKSFI